MPALSLDSEEEHLQTLSVLIAEMTMLWWIVMMETTNIVVAIVMVTLMVINAMVMMEMMIEMMEMMGMTILSGSRPPASEAE